MQTGHRHGVYRTEVDACADFDALLSKMSAFKTFREVCGRYIFSPVGKATAAPRIDRILLPAGKAWALCPVGFMGVEIKRTGEKIGPILSQMLDYRRAAYTLNGSVPANVLLDWVFVFPCDPAHSEIASLMSQNGIGTLRINPFRSCLEFFSGENAVLRAYIDGRVEPGPAIFYGRKQGSR